MRNILKKLAFILAFMLMTEAVMADTEVDIGEMNSDGETLFENIIDNEHSELAIETTTESLIVEDKVESSASIVLDLLSKLKEFKNGIVKDGVVSDSAIDYEIEESNFPDKIKGLLNDRYFELNETERFFINQYLYVREDTMKICSEQGLDIAMSIPYALIMQILNVDFEDARAMVIVYESEKAAVEQAYAYGELFADYDIFADEKLKNEFVDYALVGYTEEEVFNAYIFALVIDKNISEVIYDKHNFVSERFAVLNEYEDIIEKYSVRQEAIEEYLNLGYLLEEVDSEIKGMTKALVENGNVSLYSVDNGDNFDVGYDAAFKEGPLSYVKGINDSVDPNTGALCYSETVCSLPGINGLNFDLTISYTSNTTNTAKHIDSRINRGSNWRYNIPYLTNKNGDVPESAPKYITLADGSTFELIDRGHGYYEVNDCYQNNLKLYKDISGQGDFKSAFKLVYKNGDIQYFDINGRWIATYNRFGNSIKAVKDNSIDSELIIEDTVGRRIIISETLYNNKITQTVTAPDGSKTKFIYDIDTSSGRLKILLSEKIDAEQNITSFEYEITERNEYKNVLLKTITMPTGLKNHYDYSWTNLYNKKEQHYTTESTDENSNKLTLWGIEYDFNTYDYEYARIFKRYKEDNGKIFDTYTYNYDGNFIIANEKYYAYCGCLMPLDESACACKIYFDGGWICNSDCIDHIMGCLNIVNKAYTYNTTIESENGTKTKYYFNQYKNNTEIVEMLGDNVLNSISKSYIHSGSCSLPENITYKNYENNSVVSNFTENYIYTNLYDIKEKIVKKGTTVLSDVKYEYDYDSNSSQYYGICTKVTTKMNANTNIVQTNKLLHSGISLFNNMAISETIVKRGSVEENHIIYEYADNNSYDFSDCRLISKTDYALDKSDNSIKNISTVYSYDEGFANPTMVSYQVSTGSSSILQQYETYYTYDANERIKSVRNPENYLTKYKYNGIGNITEIEYPKNQTSLNGNLYDTSLGSDKVNIAYNYKTNTITVTNENGKKTVYDYDAVGNKSSVTSKSDGTTGAKDIVLESYKYDTRLRPTEVITGKAKTTYTYDNRDRVLTTKVTDKVTGAVLSNETYSYVNNSTGLQTTLTLKGDTTAADIVTVTQQDVLGRTYSEKVGSGTTTYTYDMLNNVIKSVGVNTNTYEYNSNGNVIKTTATTGSTMITTTATYDMLGNMITSTDGKGNTTNYSYTGLNWLSTVETPFDSTGKTNTYYGYDKVGNKTLEGVKVSATTNRFVKYEYDYKNRVIKSTMGNQTTKNEYDGVGNITKVTQVNLTGEDQVTNYAYDRRNLLKKYTDAMGQAETYTYDDYGNMISKKDRNGNTIKYSYDALGRLLNEDTEGINNRFTYNATGGVKTSVNSNVSQSYTYNNLGLIATETTGNFSISRTYDTWGRNTQNVYKKGTAAYKTQTYTYDSLSRMTKITSSGDNTVSFTASYTYDNNSNITKVSDNNCTRTYTYNNANMLTVINNDGSGSLDTKYTYEYNYDGNVKKITDLTGHITQYSYDSANRLATEYQRKTTGEFFTTNYEYDSLGNRIVKELNNTYTVWYEYDPNNRLVKEKQGFYNDNPSVQYFNITEYSYDKNGNQISKAKYNQNIENKFTVSINDINTDDSVGYEVFTYDRLNELTSYKNSKGTTAAYKYLPNHYRMSKTVDGVITQQIWDGDNIVAEANDANAILRSYTWGHQLLTDDDRRAYMYDGHGNIVQQNRGATAESITRYDAYGNKMESSNVNDVPFGYCGEYLDSESGLIYLRNRYYDSESGRFITEDPIRDGINWYAYCSGNPVMFWDPSGYTTKEETEMYRNGELSPGAYTYLAYCTYQYYLSDYESGRNYWHQEAEDFRNGKDGHAPYTYTGHPEWDEKIALMDRRPSGEIDGIEHYNRNEFNLELSWSDFQKLQERLPNEYKWNEGVAAYLHQNVKVENWDGIVEDNRKYVSYDGCFELIYNAKNVLQTEENNPKDMGTFNYYSPIDEGGGHFKYDMIPFFEYGNTLSSMSGW